MNLNKCLWILRRPLQNRSGLENQNTSLENKMTNSDKCTAKYGTNSGKAEGGWR